ncbi:macro domain-containing protein [Cellulomonas soli]
MRIEAVQGDITEQHVDVVVNAANSSLLGGGGVDGAIHAAAGPQLLEACRALRAEARFADGLGIGDAVATPAFDLPARWVVHTVGPNRHAGQVSTTALASCFGRSLEIAVELGARSLAFPAIGAGAFGWDMAEVAEVAAGVVKGWASCAQNGVLEGHTRPSGLELVRFVLASGSALQAFEDALA